MRFRRIWQPSSRVLWQTCFAACWNTTLKRISMTDVHTPEQRSFNMSRIRSRDTKPELLLRSELWRRGYRYRLKSSLPGKPDIVFHRQRLAIFVDGCFWHGCPKHFQLPKTRSEFWRKKIESNRQRDKEINALLKSCGWNVYRVWEHRSSQRTARDIARLIDNLSLPK